MTLSVSMSRSPKSSQAARISASVNIGTGSLVPQPQLGRALVIFIWIVAFLERGSQSHSGYGSGLGRCIQILLRLIPTWGSFSPAVLAGPNRCVGRHVSGTPREVVSQRYLKSSIVLTTNRGVGPKSDLSLYAD